MARGSGRRLPSSTADQRPCRSLLAGFWNSSSCVYWSTLGIFQDTPHLYAAAIEPCDPWPYSMLHCHLGGCFSIHATAVSVRWPSLFSRSETFRNAQIQELGVIRFPQIRDQITISLPRHSRSGPLEGVMASQTRQRSAEDAMHTVVSRSIWICQPRSAHSRRITNSRVQMKRRVRVFPFGMLQRRNGRRSLAKRGEFGDPHLLWKVGTPGLDFSTGAMCSIVEQWYLQRASATSLGGTAAGAYRKRARSREMASTKPE